MLNLRTAVAISNTLSLSPLVKKTAFGFIQFCTKCNYMISFFYYTCKQYACSHIMINHKTLGLVLVRGNEPM